MSFQAVLEKYRKYSFSERDKGARFERLVQAYLQTDPLYANRFKNVWLWNDFPFKKDFGGKDTGIDLVAQTNEGDSWAIQCKCFKADESIDKSAVDTFLATSSRTFTNESLQQVSFAHRLWISTTNKWSTNAEETIHHQKPPVSRISLADLEHAPVDWEALERGLSGAKALEKKKTILPHQQEAIDKFHKHFRSADRGKLIMACGTGKTFTSLKIAERETDGTGLVLFLVPSIALLGQILREWSSEAIKPINAICICSDPEVSRKKEKIEDMDGFSVEDLALPASTNVPVILKQFHNIPSTGGMTVVFSTYQSIERVSDVQKRLNNEKANKCIFDVVICDEAHRTTGVTLKGEEESAFVRVHDNGFLKAKKRIYMTATPRLYSEELQKKAKEAEVYLCSMDNSELYGEEVYRLGFGEAVEKNLLSDYKVLVLTLRDDQIPKAVQKAIADKNQEINTDDATKLIGCINALSKRMLLDAELLRASDPTPMRLALAFCQSIKVSKKITGLFNFQKEAYYESLTQEEREQVVTVFSDHIDGTMGAAMRDEKLSWLKSAPVDKNECRILTNVRVLSEGVDVPSLDAVMFLSARNSPIDVVQSVGRVMRTAPGKKYGYIIIPLLVPADVPPEQVLEDNDRFKVVWTVLNALRAHDDRFNAMINKLDLNKKTPDGKTGGGTVLVGGVPIGDEGGKDTSERLSEKLQQQFQIQFQELQSVVYARMVKKVGSKTYWEQWAASVGDIATRHIARIAKLVSSDKTHRQIFEDFLGGLRKNVNPFLTQSDAIEMLAQHMITKPVFEALFENYSFVKNNPVSISMQEMIDLLEEQALAKDQEVLEKFYASVKMRASDIDNADGRQKVIVELYEKFFKVAFPKVVEKLGIVYTPVEVVDFIIASVEEVLKKEFSRSISDENIHLIDPFAGTGTFVTRLLQSGLLKEKDLVRKYEKEIHANEIVLLAYYIASINIENVFHDVLVKSNKYRAFNGICFTDTFQLAESDNTLIEKLFPENSRRITAQKKAPIRVIVANPPYSVGQSRANDNAQNERYPRLETRIEETYVKNSTATLSKSVYDSYIKAFRWASDRLDPEHGGIVAFVSAGGWIDGNAMDGFRRSLEEEFSSIYVLNLRGNQRTTKGELSRKEGGKIFGSGSRLGVAITVLVKKPNKTGKAAIHYHDIGDYRAREEKLKIVKGYGNISSADIEWTTLHPNAHGDWLNQPDEQFSRLFQIQPEKKFDLEAKTFFNTNAIGVSTNRDSWVYNFSKEAVCENMQRLIAFYNEERQRYQKAIETKIVKNVDDFVVNDPKQIAWSRALKSDLVRNLEHFYRPEKVRLACYRPFCKQYVYFDRDLIEAPGLSFRYFPTAELQNLVISVSGIGVTSDFSAMAANCLPDLELIGKSQCFPLHYYEQMTESVPSLFDDSSIQYVERSGVSDFILGRAREAYGPKLSKEDLFYYVYGFLHSPDYKKRYLAELKKSLPRLPLVDEPRDFWAFAKAGRRLADLHSNYESAKPYPLKEVRTGKDLRVEKMRFPSKENKSTIIYNGNITLEGIPEEAYEYVVNGRSAIAWIMERYQIRIFKDSGIKNDPNDWCKEVDNPRYILDLVKRVVTVSLETMEVVKNLPKWVPISKTE